MRSNACASCAPLVLVLGVAPIAGGLATGCAADNRLPYIKVPTSEIQVALPKWYPERPWSAAEGVSRVYLEGRIVFDTDKATIRPGPSERVLATLLKFANEHPEVTLIRVEGHTDSDGSDAHNMDLSVRRSLAVCDWLVDHGIDPTRLLAVGFGRTRPIAPNSLPDGRQENRRTEIHVAEVNGRAFLTKDPANGGYALIVKSAEERRLEREALLHPPPVAKPKPFVAERDVVLPVDVDAVLRAQAKAQKKKDQQAGLTPASGGD
jgi:outer membrane protein OmpA-like peptidoglycan-associated protein